MRAQQLREYVIVPVLERLQMPNQEGATELLMMTAAAESNMGEYIHQVGGGPARGVFQMESETAKDLLTNYLHRYPALKGNVLSLAFPGMGVLEQVPGNLYLACALARVRYAPAPQDIPDKDDIENLARYYVKFYVRGGRNTEAIAVAKYKKYCLGK